MRVVNAIPYVCDAEPGIVTSADLPPTLPRLAFEGDPDDSADRGSDPFA